MALTLSEFRAIIGAQRYNRNNLQNRRSLPIVGPENLNLPFEIDFVWQGFDSDLGLFSGQGC